LALGATVSTEQTEVRNAGLLRVMSVLSTVPEGQQGLNKCTVTPPPHLGTDWKKTVDIVPALRSGIFLPSALKN
jgi:hypothetical protein